MRSEIEAEIFRLLEIEFFSAFNSSEGCECIIFDISPEKTINDKLDTIIRKLVDKFPDDKKNSTRFK